MRHAATKSQATKPAIDELQEVFKALADTTRLRSLALLGNDEVCVCHIHDSLGPVSYTHLTLPTN